MKKVLLSSAYFAPIQYYSKLNGYDEIYVEGYDHYQKQTYRNRCMIATTNGIQALTVPIERYDGQKCYTRDIRISDHGNWRHIHWKALESAYGESPFFEYYVDDLCPFFEKRWDFLFDFNHDICTKICELIDIHPMIKFTDQYIKFPLTEGYDMKLAKDIVMETDDFREVISPKHPIKDISFVSKPYYQVYKEKYGFIPNLSVLDLLFNMGNESCLYL